MSEALERTERTRLRRVPERASYDRRLAYSILDEGLIGHVGIVGDDGEPVVIPMGYARDGDAVLLHGSVASRLMRRLARGTPACVTVTLTDGLVLARSTFHHSMNYRSVVVFGRGEAVSEEPAKRAALDRLVEHLVPGRSAEARRPNSKELAATLVVRVPLAEASIKVRSGPPSDHRDDLELPVWGGVIPLATVPGAAEADADNRVAMPDYVQAYRRPRDGG